MISTAKGKAKRQSIEPVEGMREATRCIANPPDSRLMSPFAAEPGETVDSLAWCGCEILCVRLGIESNGDVALREHWSPHKPTGAPLTKSA